MDENLTNRIRERAYEIWAGSGCSDEAAEQHWLAAERESLEASMSGVATSRPAAKKTGRSSSRATPKKLARLAG